MKTVRESRYQELVHKSLELGAIDKDDMSWILTGEDVEILPLLHAAYQVRYRFFGNRVRIHILNSVKSGNCDVPNLIREEWKSFIN